MNSVGVGGVAQIDWSPPWINPWCPPGEPIARQIVAGAAQHEALTAAGLAPVRFVPQGDLPGGMAYEQFVFERGEVPTRAGLHDFFNGLCWILFPRAKLQMNRRQADEIAAAGVGAVRGSVRDAITVLDENGALLHAPDALWNALATRQWQRLFGELRSLWAQAQLLVFGHAALEKLVTPYKSITVHVWRVGPAWTDLAGLDAWLAQDLTAARLACKPFVPLPVLGVPGWWPANEDPAYYRDDHVFRPAHLRGRPKAGQRQ